MQSHRELSTFPLAPNHKVKLTAAGFLTVEDLKDVRPSELSKEFQISPEEAVEILNLVRGEGGSRRGQHGEARSALDILRQEDSLNNIITFSQQLDDMLGGGVPLCKTTEFCGAPGVGKTQVCLQLAVDVQIPEVFGGTGGEAVYVDTEGSFLVERLVDIAKATIEHCQQITNMDSNQEQLEAMEGFTLEAILSGVHYYRCHDYVQLLATVHLLSEFISKHPKVKLIVIDSIAFPFRHDFDDMALRTRLLMGMAQIFIKLATSHKLAVVLTNQMTTKIMGKQGSQLIPALGESWGHASTIRVILYWEGQHRHAQLYKSPFKQEAVIQYQITTGGIRDICSDSNNHRASNDEPEDSSLNEPPSKKPKHL